MQRFAYERPGTLGEAIGLLVAHGSGAAAGRWDGPDHPPARPDDLGRRGGRREAGAGAGAGDPARGRPAIIGAGTVMTDIAEDATIRTRFAALAEAALVVGSVQIRNRATLAGNICNASPAADTAPALLVYGAEVVVAGPAGRGASRSTTGSSAPASRRCARGARHRDRIAAGRRAGRGDARPADPAARPRPGIGHARLRGAARGPGHAGLRECRTRPWLVTDRWHACRPRLVHGGAAGVLDGCSRLPHRRRPRCASPEYRLAMLRVLGLRAIETAPTPRRVRRVIEDGVAIQLVVNGRARDHRRTPSHAARRAPRGPRPDRDEGVLPRSASAVPARS